MPEKSTSSRLDATFRPRPEGKARINRPRRSRDPPPSGCLERLVARWRQTPVNERRWMTMLGLGVVLGIGLSLMLTYVLCLIVGFLAGLWWAKRPNA